VGPASRRLAYWIAAAAGECVQWHVVSIRRKLNRDLLTLCNAGVHRHSDRVHSDVIHVATATPVCLYSMDTRKQHWSCVDLYDVFPGTHARYQSYRPRLHLAPLGFPLDTSIIIHDELASVFFYGGVVLLLNALNVFTNNCIC